MQFMFPVSVALYHKSHNIEKRGYTGDTYQFLSLVISPPLSHKTSWILNYIDCLAALFTYLPTQHRIVWWTVLSFYIYKKVFITVVIFKECLHKTEIEKTKFQILVNIE